MTHRSKYLPLLPLLVGALFLNPSMPAHAKKPAPRPAPLSSKKKLANAYLVSLWTDKKGDADKEKISGLTQQTFQKALAKGADINAKDKRGTTALMIAAEADKTDVVHYLLSKKAKINVKAYSGMTALMEAASSGDTAMIDLLLAHGADVNAQGKERQTALLLATSLGNADVVKVLLAHGANTNGKDDHDNTALGIATLQGRTEIVNLLKAAGAK